MPCLALGSPAPATVFIPAIWRHHRIHVGNGERTDLDCGNTAGRNTERVNPIDTDPERRLESVGLGVGVFDDTHKVN